MCYFVLSMSVIVHVVSMSREVLLSSFFISVGKTDVVDISLIKNKTKHHFVSKIFYYQIL